MSLKTVVDEVCDVVSLSHTEAVYGNDDPNAQTMLTLAQQGGAEIARRVDWQRMLKTFLPVAGNVRLPEDFQRLVPGAAVSTTEGDFVRPVTNSGQWRILVASPSSQPFFFIQANSFSFLPLSLLGSLWVDYVSKNWILGTTEELSEWNADDNETLFPERLLALDLIWRWRRKQGLSYDDQLAEFEAALVQEIQADRGAS